MDRHDIEKIIATHFEESALDAQDVEKMGIEPLVAEKVQELLGDARPGYRIPYFTRTGAKTPFYRVRFVGEGTGFAKQGERPAKYKQPANTPADVYLPPLLPNGKTWDDVLKDPSVPLLITEGEKKAACATKHGVHTLGLGGVWSFKSKRQQKMLIEPLENVAWRGRPVIVVFDSDAAENEQIIAAEVELSQTLTKKGGAEVSVLRIPHDPGGAKLGVDDYIYLNGAEAFIELCSTAQVLDEYTRMLWDLQRKVVFIKDNGMVVAPDTHLTMRPQDFTRSHYAHWTVQVPNARGTGSRRVCIAQEWMDWPHRREAHTMDFVPGRPLFFTTPEGSRVYNTWRQWGCEPKRGSVAPFHRFMTHLFEGNKEAIHWVTCWLALPLQEPGEKLETAVSIWSEETGTGKTTLGRLVQGIYGKWNDPRNSHWLLLEGAALEASFNSWAGRALFCLVDDLTLSKTRATRISEFLKPLITQSTVTVNEKFKNPYTVTARTNFLFTSNHPDQIRIDPSDRRFFVQHVTETKMPEDMQEELYSWLKGPGSAALFYYLLHYDLRGFSRTTPPLMTAAKTQAIELNRGDVEREVDLIISDHQSGASSQLAADCDLFTAEQITASLRETGDRVSARHISAVLAQHKHAMWMGKVKLSDGRVRSLYAIRNLSKWDKIRRSRRYGKLREVAEHWEEHFCVPTASQGSTVGRPQEDD